MADEREERISAQDRELQDLRCQTKGLRIEATTLTDRATHVDELRVRLKTLQAQQGRAIGGDKRKATPKRRRKTTNCILARCMFICPENETNAKPIVR